MKVDINPETGNKRYTIRQSWQDQFGMCPEKARFSMGETERWATDSTATGTSMHAYIQSRLEGEDHGKSTEVAWDALEMEWNLPAFRNTEDTSILAAFETATELGRIWEHKVKPALQPHIGIETGFRHQVDERFGVELWITGTRDYDHHLGVADWKTGKSRTIGKYYAANKLPIKIQASVYTLAWTIEQGLDPQTAVVPFDYWVGLKDTMDWRRFPTYRSIDDWTWAIEKMWSAVRLHMELPDGPWPMVDTDWWCSRKWCESYDQCRGAERTLFIA